MRKVVWGVLSTAKIGLQKVLPGMQKSPLCEIRAIASRSADSARKAASQLGIAKAYGSYEELLADPEIEAIYNPLPNHLHVPLTLKAAAAGKHVLCEKPIALSAEEARQLEAAAGKVLIMEAFMVRFHRAVRGEIALPYGVGNAVLGMRMIDALFRSETTRRWEDI